MLIQEALKQSDKIRRLSWANKKSYVTPNGLSFFMIFCNGNNFNPSKDDIIADDWEVYREPLKLEVGKFYKTVDGRKAYVYSFFEGKYPYCFCVHGTYNSSFIAKEDGQCREDEGLSIVSKWEASND